MPAAKTDGTVVLIASNLPARSETFVTRELRGLRARGWRLRPVTLHRTAEAGFAEFADVAAGLVTVYGRPGRLLGAFLAAALVRPLRTLRTLLLAARDAVRPGEPTPLATRLKLLPQAAVAVAVARGLRGDGVTHVHCHFAHAPATIGMYLAAQLGVPFSFVGHANDLFQRRALLRRKLERAAFVSCISEWHRQLYLGLCGSRADRFHVVRCGVPTASFRPASHEAAGEPTIVSIARLVAKKGLDTLLRATAIVTRETGLRPVVRIVGDGPERARLEQLARDEQCRVEWLGALDNDAARAALAGATVFALPCRVDANGDRDGIPVALMEAMACGIPSVAGDLPAIRELIEHDDCGILVDAGGPDELAGVLARLLRDPTRRQQLAHRGVERIREEFTLDLNLDRLERCLDRARS